MSAHEIRVLVADDHPLVREGLTAVLNRQPDMQVVAEASDGREAVALFRRHRPDVALMDLRMPHFGGVEATEMIRAEFPESRIIVLTTYGGDEDIHRALTAGARAYLLKDTSNEGLVTAIRSVHQGQRHLPADVSMRLAQHFDANELTAREREILTLIVRGHRNKKIGELLGITEGTVKGHINNILGKLGVEDRTQAATEAIRRGLVYLD